LTPGHRTDRTRENLHPVKIRYLIANAYPVGGTIRTTLGMANALSARGHDVEIISVLKRRAVPSFPVSPGVDLHPLVDTARVTREAEDAVPGARAAVRRSLHRRLERAPSRLIHKGDFRYPTFNLRTDIALIRFLRGTRDGILIGTRAGLNLAMARYAHNEVVRVGQEHLHNDIYSGDIREAMAKYYPRLDAYVTLTSGDRDKFAEHLAGRPRLLTIPNAVPAIDDVRSSLDAKVVVAAGRLAKQKGFDRLIKAWAKVAAARPDWELRIFGAGILEDDLRRRIADHGLERQVRLMGYTKNLAAEMAAASMYVMTSRNEGFPMVLLEAMKCGLPVVSYDLPNGPRDLVTQGVDGYVVANRDADAFASRVLELIEDEPLRKRMGAAAVEKAAGYSIDRIAVRWEEVFEELVAAKRGSRA
jgi:glycosyltransferase involved in cell wall biosynthesis